MSSAPWARATSSTARLSGAVERVARGPPGPAPMVAVRPLRSTGRCRCGGNRAPSIASWTRRPVSGVTPGSPLTTRETVLRPTPARVATSFMVGRPRPFRRTGPPGPLGPPAPLAPSGPPGPVSPPPGGRARPGGSPGWLGMPCARSRGRLSRTITDHGCFPCSSRRTAGTLGWPPACSGVIPLPAARSVPPDAAVPARPGRALSRLSACMPGPRFPPKASVLQTRRHG